MKKLISKYNVFRIVIVIWLVLWVVFIIREDKDDQYAGLKYLYSHGYTHKVSRITGKDLFEFIIFCRENIPAGATYEIKGFEMFSIDEVRTRYYMWPSRNVSKNGEYMIIYGAVVGGAPGYEEYMTLEGKGSIMMKKGGEA
jgi:hypothetical protein